MREDIGRVRRALDEIAADERADPLIEPRNVTSWWLHDHATEHVAVLLHGLTNCPRQWAELGPQLHADGHNVIAPRFPYHGYRDRMTTALEHLKMHDVLATALGAIAIAARAGRRVHVIGISVSGTICAWLAGRVAVETAIAVAPFFGIKQLPGCATDAFATAIGRLPNAFLWWDPVHRERAGNAHSYPRFSTRALGEMLRLGILVERAAASPVYGKRLVLVLNERDPAVNNAFARRRVAALQRAGLRVDVIARDDLPPQHDIIEPQLAHAPTALVYPMLRGLISANR